MADPDPSSPHIPGATDMPITDLQLLREAFRGAALDINVELHESAWVFTAHGGGVWWAQSASATRLRHALLGEGFRQD